MSDGASKDVRQFTVGADDNGIRLDRWFKRNLPQIGFAMISRWARTGQIRVDGKRAKPEDRLEEGQILRVPPGGENTARGPKKPRELSAADIAQAQNMVIEETPSAIILNKPPGLATQGGSKTTKHVDGLLDAFTPAEGAANAGIRPRLVHRLDKDTSGVLLIARTPGSAASFSKRFASHSARKVYWAIITGVPEVFEGTIDAPLAKQPGTGGEKMHVDEVEGKSAKTRYRVVERAGNSAAWVELEPLTGRTHQLRAHMAAIGHPIVGDGKYGGQDAFLTGSVSRKMHLHARRLVISQPGEGAAKIDAVADLPEHFAQTMEHMGFNVGVSDADPLIIAPPEKTREEKKQAARKHAKQYRKDRRGERRSRTAGVRGNTGGDPVGRRKKTKKRSGKPNGKPAGRNKSNRR